MSFDLLNHLMIVLMAVTCILAVCAKLRLPTVLGYLFSGLLVGPEGLDILSAPREMEFLSEMGMMLMMFMAGLEFSWPLLRKHWRTLVGMGATSVVSITTAVTAVLMFFGFGMGESFLIGGAAAMSSTALVTKQLVDQEEFHASHGRDVFSLALFQDLATLVFLAAIPALALQETQSFLKSLAVSLGTMVAVFIGLYFAGRQIERPLMRLVGGLKSNEIFVLTTLLIILGGAWISHYFSLPATIGAFMAGMLIGETEFKYKTEEDIRPFRDILVGVFFIGIGVTLKFSVMVLHFPFVLAALGTLIVIKFALTVLAAALWGATAGSSVRIGLILAHGGEFSLLLLVLGMKEGLIEGETGQILLAATVLSLMLSTVLILYNQALAIFFLSFFGGAKKIQGEKNGASDEDSYKNLSGHIILCGFGETGRNLHKALIASDIPMIVVETDSQKVVDAVNKGCQAIYGDAANLNLLKSVGIAQAKALVITFDNYAETLKILHRVRSENLALPIIVRIHHLSHVEDLLMFGATAVLPEGVKTGLSMGREILKTLKMPEDMLPDEKYLQRNQE